MAWEKLSVIWVEEFEMGRVANSGRFFPRWSGSRRRKRWGGPWVGLGSHFERVTKVVVSHVGSFNDAFGLEGLG